MSDQPFCSGFDRPRLSFTFAQKDCNILKHAYSSKVLNAVSTLVSATNLHYLHYRRCINGRIGSYPISDEWHSAGTFEVFCDLLEKNSFLSAAKNPSRYYTWYAVTSDTLNATNATISDPSTIPMILSFDDIPRFLYIWLICYDTAVIAEQNGTATEPSLISQQISDEHAKAGQNPVISIKGNSIQLVSDADYDAALHVWKVSLMTTSSGVAVVSISGNGVAIMDRWPGITYAMIVVRSLDVQNLEPKSLISGPKSVRIRRASCAPNVMAASFNMSSFAFSESLFIGEESFLSLPSNLTIRSVEISQTSLLILTDNGLFVYRNQSLRQSVFQPSDQSYETLNVVTPSACDTLLGAEGQESDLNNRVLAFHFDSARFWASNDSGLTFTLRDLHVDNYSLLRVLAATVVVPFAADVIIADVNGTIYSLQCPFLSTNCTLGQKVPSSFAQSSCEMHIVTASDASAAVLVSGNGLMGSQDGGLTIYQITLQSNTTGINISDSSRSSYRIHNH